MGLSVQRRLRNKTSVSFPLLNEEERNFVEQSLLVFTVGDGWKKDLKKIKFCWRFVNNRLSKCPSVGVEERKTTASAELLNFK